MSDLNDLRTAITGWIGKRKATVEAMEKLAEEMKKGRMVCNRINLGAAVAEVACNASVIFGNDWVARFANYSGIVTSFPLGPMELIKNNGLSLLLQEAMSVIDQEMEEYKTVIGTLDQLYDTVAEKESLQVDTKIVKATLKIVQVVGDRKAMGAKAAKRDDTKYIMGQLAKTYVATVGHMALLGYSLIHGKAYPMISGALAMWGAYEGYKAITSGSREEDLLKEKIKELRKEANVIMDEIFNVFADALGEPPIDNPFKKCRVCGLETQHAC